jgi:hypothetical protein
LAPLTTLLGSPPVPMPLVLAAPGEAAPMEQQ